MPDPATILADIRAAIACLAEADDRCARVGRALEDWLRGTSLEASLGLLPGWRARRRLSAQNHALTALVRMRTGMSANALADWIVDGLGRVAVDGVRPDGADGYLVDLARSGCAPSKRQLRRLIAAVGHRAS